MPVYHTKSEQETVVDDLESKLIARSLDNDTSIFASDFLKKYEDLYVDLSEHYTHYNEFIVVPWANPLKEGFVYIMLILIHFLSSFFIFNYIFLDRFLTLFFVTFACFISGCIYLYNYRSLNKKYIVLDKNKQLLHIIGLNKDSIETLRWEDVDFLLFESHVYEMVTTKPVKFSLMETANLFLLRPGANGRDIFETQKKSWPGHGQTIRLSLMEALEHYSDRDIDHPESRGILIKHHLFYKMLAEFMTGNNKQINQRELVDCLDCMENMEGDYQYLVRRYKPSLLKIPFHRLPEKVNWERDLQGNWQQLYRKQLKLSLKDKIHERLLQPPDLLIKMSVNYPESLTQEQHELRTKITRPNPDYIAELEKIDRENKKLLRISNIFFISLAVVSFVFGMYGRDVNSGMQALFFVAYFFHMPWYLALLFMYIKERSFHA